MSTGRRQGPSRSMIDVMVTSPIVSDFMAKTSNNLTRRTIWCPSAFPSIDAGKLPRQQYKVKALCGHRENRFMLRVSSRLPTHMLMGTSDLVGGWERQEAAVFNIELCLFSNKQQTSNSGDVSSSWNGEQCPPIDLSIRVADRPAYVSEMRANSRPEWMQWLLQSERRKPQSACVMDT